MKECAVLKFYGRMDVLGGNGMRRQDREVTDRARIREIIDSCSVCRLGFCDKDEVYIVPLNFGYEETDGKSVFYFHGAKTGRKADLIRRSASVMETGMHRVGFELDRESGLVDGGEQACRYSMRYCSVIGSGYMSELEEPEEKRQALNCIMAHYTEKTAWEYPDEMLNAVGVFRLEAEKLSCKERK